MSDTEDPEVHAITTLVPIFEKLQEPARISVLAYIVNRFKIPQASAAPIRLATDPAIVTPTPDLIPGGGGAQKDIRTFADEKGPKTANQMVALVAYYLAHLAPPEERRDYIQPNDIKTYFSLIYPLPKRLDQALINARQSGYLTAIGNGRYRLNPVGHNLVVHKMGTTGVETGRRKPQRRRSAAKGVRGKK